MTTYHFNRPLATLAQDRKDRKERRKDMFFGPPGQQKNAFLRVLRGLRGSSFYFLTARSLRSPKMSTEKRAMINIEKKIVVDEQGLPQEVIISWKQYKEIEEILGLDMDERATEDLRKAKEDRLAENSDSYVRLDAIDD
jgi:hypothetical protein